MNLKTWFKGLGVFVASSFITGLAATNLSPSTFNFSKQGLSKLAALAAVIGIKAVVLYLKQSPLPGSGAVADWTKISGTSVLVLALPLAGLVSGCVSSWEQDTYATLATGKALIDCAVAGYNHADADIRNACAATPDDAAFDPTKFYIPQTRSAQQAIETARHAQVACVEAFEAYAVAKVAKDKSVSVAQKQSAVAGFLAQLPALLEALRELFPVQSAQQRGGLLNLGFARDRKSFGEIGGMNAKDVVTLIRGLEANRPDAAALSGLDLERVDGSSSPMIRSTRESSSALVHPQLEIVQFRSPDHPITGSTDTKEVSRGQ